MPSVKEGAPACGSVAVAVIGCVPHSIGTGVQGAAVIWRKAGADLLPSESLTCTASR